MEKDHSTRWIIWTCGDCGKQYRTLHSNLPKLCKCGGIYFKYTKTIKRGKITLEEKKRIKIYNWGNREYDRRRK